MNIKLSSLIEGFIKKNEWTIQEKKAALDVIGKYNEYGKYLRREKSLMEIAETFANIAESAEKFTMNEEGDWFDKNTVGRNMKELGRCSSEFRKLAQESHIVEQRMEALYEDMGRKMERYFEIQSLDEIASAIPTEESAPAPQMGESAEEQEECGMEQEESLEEASDKKKHSRLQ